MVEKKGQGLSLLPLSSLPSSFLFFLSFCLSNSNGNWRMAKYYARTEKKISSKMSTTPSYLPGPFEYCAQRKRQDGPVYQAKLRVRIPKSKTTLCVNLLNARRTKVDYQQAKQPVIAPMQARGFLTHSQMDLMDLRN